MFAAIFQTNAQTVNGVPIQDIDVEYIQITGDVNIYVDFGQAKEARRDTRIKDKDGNAIKFNSIIDGLNFMSANGYEHVDTYVIVDSRGDIHDNRITSKRYYLLKKKI